MEAQPIFTWYEIMKDYVNGDFGKIVTKAIDGFVVPDECYHVTFTFVVGLFTVLFFLIRKHPPFSKIVRMLCITDNTEEKGEIPVVIKQKRHMSEDKKEEKNRTFNITNEYKVFGPSVINIMGKNVDDTEKVNQIMNKIEDLSKDAIIGYKPNKKVNANISRILERFYS